MAAFSRLSRFQDAALLFMRLVLGLMMIYYGFPKLKGGPILWKEIGTSMHQLGIHDFPTFWGFMAGFAEAVGGLMVVLGWFFRPACLLIAFTMLVAALHHFGKGDGLSGAGHALELGAVFLALAFVGPGRFALEK